MKRRITIAIIIICVIVSVLGSVCFAAQPDTGGGVQGPADVRQHQGPELGRGK